MTPTPDKTKDELIAEGICVSDGGVDRCVKCVDVCEAFRWRIELLETLNDKNIQTP